MHAETSRTQWMTFGFKASAWINDIFAPILV